MTRIVVEILRDAALRPTSIKVKGLKVGYEYYPTGAVSKVILSGRRASIPRLFEVLDMIYPRDVTVSTRGSEWFDRNPTSFNDAYTVVAVNPHTTTVRLTYTCPKEKIAIVELLSAGLTRSVAAQTVGRARARWRLTVKNKSIKTLLESTLVTNNVGDSKDLAVGGQITMYADDLLQALTIDESSGTPTGNIDYRLIVKLTEFDA